MYVVTKLLPSSQFTLPDCCSGSVTEVQHISIRPTYTTAIVISYNDTGNQTIIIYIL